MRLQIIVARECITGEEIMHRFVELNSYRRSLMVQQEKNAGIVFLPHADLDGIGHFEERVEVAHLAQPDDQVAIKGLMTLRADVDGFAKPIRIHGHSRAARVTVFGIRGENLTLLRLEQIAPQSGGVQMACRKYAFKG